MVAAFTPKQMGSRCMEEFEPHWTRRLLKLETQAPGLRLLGSLGETNAELHIMAFMVLVWMVLVWNLIQYHSMGTMYEDAPSFEPNY